MRLDYGELDSVSADSVSYIWVFTFPLINVTTHYDSPYATRPTYDYRAGGPSMGLQLCARLFFHLPWLCHYHCCSCQLPLLHKPNHVGRDHSAWDRMSFYSGNDRLWFSYPSLHHQRLDSPTLVKDWCSGSPLPNGPRYNWYGQWKVMVWTMAMWTMAKMT